MHDKYCMKKIIDYTAVQNFYNQGHSWREVTTVFGIHNKALQSAIKQGDLITRSREDTNKLKRFKRVNKIKNTPKQINWTDIQEFYDRGNSLLDVNRVFGTHFTLLNQGRKDGFLITRNASDAMKNAYANGRAKAAIPTAEQRTKNSEKLTLNNIGPHCKWYVVNGVKLQGRWERNVALALNKHNISWIRPDKNHIFKYSINQKVRSYSADFYLPELDIYLEIKGYWWRDDELKMKIVKEAYPDKTLLIWMKAEYDQLMQDSKTFLSHVLPTVKSI